VSDLPQRDSIRAVVALQESLHPMFVVLPIERADALLVVRDQQHAASWRIDAFERERMRGHENHSPITTMTAPTDVVWQFSDMVHLTGMAWAKL
jgi:hypothetical protein